MSDIPKETQQNGSTTEQSEQTTSPVENTPTIIADEDGDKLCSLADLPESALADAMAQLNNPNKPLLADEIKQDETTTTTTTTTIEEAKVEAKKERQSWENPEELAVNDKGKNGRNIVCPFCLKSMVILANAGTHVKMETFLPYPNATTENEGSMVEDMFKLTSKMDFENITVKRPVVGQPFRYLTCGDCESGPLGITYDKDNNRIFYISHDRVRYAAPKK